MTIRFDGRTAKPRRFKVGVKLDNGVEDIAFLLPEIAAGLLVVGLHWWKRNSLLSIVSGVVLYMVLIQKIFP